MPTTKEILDSLTRIANEATAIAIAWHVVLAVVLIALLLGWRPMQRTARVLVAAPLLSVAALGFAFGNPFNPDQTRQITPQRPRTIGVTLSAAL